MGFPFDSMAATVLDAEKLKGWLNDARHHWWERALERITRFGFFASILIAFAIEASQSSPEVVTGAHAIGEVVRNLAYGYAAAYIFHVLVVTWPARARARRAYRAIGARLAKLISLLTYSRLGVRERRLMASEPPSQERWMAIHKDYAARCEAAAKELVALAVDLPLESARIVAQLAEPGDIVLPNTLPDLLTQSQNMHDMGDKLLSDWTRVAKSDPRRPELNDLFRAPEMNALLSELAK